MYGKDAFPDVSVTVTGKLLLDLANEIERMRLRRVSRHGVVTVEASAKSIVNLPYANGFSSALGPYIDGSGTP